MRRTVKIYDDSMYEIQPINDAKTHVFLNVCLILTRKGEHILTSMRGDNRLRVIV